MIRSRAGSVGAALGVPVALIALCGLIISAPAWALGRADADRRPADVTQLITVTARSHSTTYATFTAYARSHDHWARVFGPWTARVGYNGIARPGAKREGDGKTPSGTYGFEFFFGVLPNPRVAFSYRRARRYDVWDDDPASPNYNEWIDERYRNPGRDPEPMDQRPAYDYAAVIAYNTKRVPGRGSAIFLHVGTGQATAGCVSLPRTKLVAVLRWMRPGDHPQIVISVTRPRLAPASPRSAA
jgi:L,D-peptidoglycan transpeptidase YkuD (ErfK/YbiS/YcfS/YnhG family)